MRQRLRRRDSRRRSGSALMAAIYTLMILSTLGGAVVTLTMNSVRNNDRQRRGAVAFNLAESGAQRAGLWLREQSELGSLPTSTTTLSNTLGGGSYSTTIALDVPNSSSGRNYYTIVSTGTAYGQTQQVELELRQGTFGKYAY